MKRLRTGVRYMAAAALFFSVMSLLVKGLGQRLPTQEVVLGRGVVSLVLSYLAVKRARIPLWGNRRKLLLLRGLLGFSALSCFFYALVHLPLADATVIQYMSPVFTALLATVVLAEGIGVLEAACVLGSLLGVILVARPSFLFGAGAALDPVATGVGLAGALLSAGAYVTVRRLGATEHPYVIVYYFALATTVGSLPFAAPSLLWPTPVEWFGLLGVGMTTQVAQIYLTRGLKLEPAGRATAVGYLQIVFAASWGVIFFGEVPGGLAIVGAAFIVGNTFVLASRRQEPRLAAAGAAAERAQLAGISGRGADLPAASATGPQEKA